MKKFSKEELISLGVIFSLLLLISIPNFSLSIKRARDVTRKDDAGRIADALGSFQEHYHRFPGATADGRIVACIGSEPANELGDNFIPCEWGQGTFIGKLPQDPHAGQGVKYFYATNGSHYQIFIALEAKDDDQYREGVFKRNIRCGSRICNAGKFYGPMPLEKELGQYENKIYAD